MIPFQFLGICGSLPSLLTPGLCIITDSFNMFPLDGSLARKYATKTTPNATTNDVETTTTKATRDLYQCPLQQPTGFACTIPAAPALTTNASNSSSP
jgi:hypothetical protein